jgi:hypothetical protein
MLHRVAPTPIIRHGPNNRAIDATLDALSMEGSALGEGRSLQLHGGTARLTSSIRFLSIPSSFLYSSLHDRLVLLVVRQ